MLKASYLVYICLSALKHASMNSGLGRWHECANVTMPTTESQKSTCVVKLRKQRVAAPKCARTCLCAPHACSYSQVDKLKTTHQFLRACIVRAQLNLPKAFVCVHRACSAKRSPNSYTLTWIVTTGEGDRLRSIMCLCACVHSALVRAVAVWAVRAVFVLADLLFWLLSAERTQLQKKVWKGYIVSIHYRMFWLVNKLCNSFILIIYFRCDS